MSNHKIFISYTTANRNVAGLLTDALERSGIKCWISFRDVKPGESWGDAITKAISECKAIILVLSANSASSQMIRREVEFAHSRQKRIIIYRIENETPSFAMDTCRSPSQWFDAFGTNHSRNLDEFVKELPRLLPNEIALRQPSSEDVSQSQPKSKGYVFISYVRSDADFVLRLRSVLESKKYGYWDYAVGDRDFHGALYRELEERIDGAVAFMSIVSDDWRKSDWVASEFIYAKEAAIPIFVVQAKKLTKPLPILLNLQTRIDMATDFESGTRTLVQELSKKAL